MSTEIAEQAVPLELSAPVKLNETHDLDAFDCGEDSINEYLKKKAIKAQIAKTATVFVVCIKDTGTVVGYYTLSNGMIMRANVVPKKAQRNSPDQHPITILGRMGVCKTLQGTGLSLDLIQDAVLRALTASEDVASTALVVHPLNDRLVGLYEKAGFLRSPQLSSITMMLPFI
ncbi:GNAT family N-acetyltransferase [Pseudomonas sp. NPDC087697]|uniref:GNAT family N-acetyltransferase n=1 Tax=Pseudomonas sp. NPDC087697 TaxID=3364447 RepID=UPI003801CE37